MKYQMIVRIPFEGLDDIEARAVAQKIKGDMEAIYEDSVCKLQEVFETKPPRGINLGGQDGQ